MKENTLSELGAMFTLQAYQIDIIKLMNALNTKK